MSGEGVLAASAGRDDLDLAEPAHVAVLPAIREAVLAMLPGSDPAWQREMRAGKLDGNHNMRMAIAGWYVGAGVPR